MFESIIVTVVNKYLGKFVENLDSSQLSIGLLGGMFALLCFRVTQIQRCLFRRKCI
jgi:hypothetical protein